MPGTGRRSLKQVNEHQEECLNILQEECAEVIQACSKIKRFGLIGKSLNTTLTNRESLEMELGDVLALVDLVKGAGLGVTNEGIEKARLDKMKRLSRFMHTWAQSSEAQHVQETV
jgi:NTP pyrophosphatase (non-canonical NTP hydrolase)